MYDGGIQDRSLCEQELEHMQFVDSVEVSKAAVSGGSLSVLRT